MEVASFRTDHYIVESEIGVQEIVIANTLQCSVSLWNYLLTARQVVSAIRRTSKMGATKKCKCFKWNNFSGWSTCNTVVHSTAASIRGTHMEEWVHSADTGCWRRCIFRLPLAMWAITSRQFIASVRLNGGSSKTCWIIVTHNSHAWCKQISDTLIHPHYIVECENFVAKKKKCFKEKLIADHPLCHHTICFADDSVKRFLCGFTHMKRVSLISFVMTKLTCVSGRRFINHI